MKTILRNRLFYVGLFLSLVGCTINEGESTQEQSGNMTNDPHPFARPPAPVMTHLNWEGSVDFEKRRIDAVARISIAGNDDTKKLILDTKNLNIQSVTLGEAEDTATFLLGEGNEHMGQPLQIDITPKTKIVNVYYH